MHLAKLTLIHDKNCQKINYKNHKINPMKEVQHFQQIVLKQLELRRKTENQTKQNKTLNKTLNLIQKLN